MTILEQLKQTSDDNERLMLLIQHFGCDSGAIHRLNDDNMLCLKANGPGMPQQVLEKIQTIPIGKGMAGLAVERNKPVNSCNIQQDTTGDVNPGAKETGLQGSIVVPIRNSEGKAIGSLGIASHKERTFSEEEIAELEQCALAIA